MTAPQILAQSKGGLWLKSDGLQSTFNIDPFACHCGPNGSCGLCEIDVRLIDGLDRVQRLAKMELEILNSCRCDAIPGSAHLPVSTAADYRSTGRPFDLFKLFIAAQQVFSAAGGGVGLYISQTNKDLPFLHSDLKTGRNNGFWYRENAYQIKTGNTSSENKPEVYRYFKTADKCWDAYCKYVEKKFPWIYKDYIGA